MKHSILYTVTFILSLHCTALNCQNELLHNKENIIQQKFIGQSRNILLGSAISISGDGNTLAFKQTDITNESASIVKVFKYISNNWVQFGKEIEGENVGDVFGYSLSLSDNGNIIAVGAPNNNYSSGHTRVFKNISGNWEQIGQDIDGEAKADGLGVSVDLSKDGSILAIGASQNDGNGELSGHVRIYKNISDRWIQIGKDIDGEGKFDFSGASLSLSDDGNIVGIGSEGNNVNGYYSGHVRIFKNVSDNWVQIGKDIDGESNFDYFGSSVSLSGNGNIIAIGGASSEDNTLKNQGYVRIFKNINEEWIQLGQDLYGESKSDNFGKSISLSNGGNILAIGAYLNDYNGSNSGSVHVFEYIEDSWQQLDIKIRGENSQDYLGKTISLSSSGGFLAVGVPQYNTDNFINCGQAFIINLKSILKSK